MKYVRIPSPGGGQDMAIYPNAYLEGLSQLAPSGGVDPVRATPGHKMRGYPVGGM